jgi:hypothetical protein
MNHRIFIEKIFAVIHNTGFILIEAMTDEGMMSALKGSPDIVEEKGVYYTADKHERIDFITQERVIS